MSDVDLFVFESSPVLAVLGVVDGQGVGEAACRAVGVGEEGGV